MKSLLLVASLALMGATNPCFGDKPIFCEAWHHVYMCNKWGCVNYGLSPIDPYKKWPSSDRMGVMGVAQWLPDGSGVLNVACVPFTDVAAMCQGVPDPESIPQAEMRPIHE